MIYNILSRNIKFCATSSNPHVTIFGNDYMTPDGTGIRDYIHVEDLAYGHICALNYINRGLSNIFNLGTGKGTSVLELIKILEKVSGNKINYIYGPRRSGDIAIVYADPTNANVLLGWNSVKTIEDMCIDAWRWQSMNINGYQ